MAKKTDTQKTRNGTLAKKKRATAKAQRVIDPFETVAEPIEAPAATTRTKAATKRRTAAAKRKAVAVDSVVTAKAEQLALKPLPKTNAKKDRQPRKSTKKFEDVTEDLAATAPKVELSPVFKALAEPTLPELKREDRARLLMQSPTELYFYWSIRRDPYHSLRDVFGDDTGSYTLVLKLKDLRRGTEEIHRVEAEGNWWFAVEPEREYRAEIGFYAPNRPYFRIVYSNTVETPRRSPSRHPARDAEWRVTAHKFAEVLDVSGFGQDAFDVAMAGDDVAAARDAAHAAFSSFIGFTDDCFDTIAAEDIRYAMVALASGSMLEDIRWRVGPAMFSVLQSNTDKLQAGRAQKALTEYFEIDETDVVEEECGPTVHGSSLLHFPRTLKTRRPTSTYIPLSSYSIGR